jgi:hypothetical protein
LAAGWVRVSESALAKQEIDLMIYDFKTSSPAIPFLMIRDLSISRFSLSDRYEKLSYKDGFLHVFERDFEQRKLEQNIKIIDIDCWEFPIIDVLNLGRRWELWSMLGSNSRVKVRYIYDTPVKVTFEQAREEIVELICRKRWFSKTQDHESEKQFRERMALCENMRDLIIGRPNTDPKTRKRFHWIGGISFYGERVG